MTTYRHTAYNCLTGEVIQCVTANQLKRAVAINSAWAQANGFPSLSKCWLFSHNGEVSPKAQDPYYRRLAWL